MLAFLNGMKVSRVYKRASSSRNLAWVNLFFITRVPVADTANSKTLEAVHIQALTFTARKAWNAVKLELVKWHSR